MIDLFVYILIYIYIYIYIYTHIHIYIYVYMICHGGWTQEVQVANHETCSFRTWVMLVSFEGRTCLRSSSKVRRRPFQQTCRTEGVCKPHAHSTIVDRVQASGRRPTSLRTAWLRASPSLAKPWIETRLPTCSSCESLETKT